MTDSIAKRYRLGKASNFFSKERLLSLAEASIIPTVILLIGIGAFGLGRRSALEDKKVPIVIHPPGDPAGIAQPTPASVSNEQVQPLAPQDKNFVASKSGTKYYTPTCSGVKRIKPANQVWFAKAADAQAAGYSAATNCAGL